MLLCVTGFPLYRISIDCFWFPWPREWVKTLPGRQPWSGSAAFPRKQAAVYIINHNKPQGHKGVRQVKIVTIARFSVISIQYPLWCGLTNSEPLMIPNWPDYLLFAVLERAGSRIICGWLPAPGSNSGPRSRSWRQLLLLV